MDCVEEQNCILLSNAWFNTKIKFVLSVMKTKVWLSTVHIVFIDRNLSQISFSSVEI